MITRRDVLTAAGAGALVSTLPIAALARAETDARFVLVILRGAADGLAVAAPYGDGHYRGVRGEIALPAPGETSGLLKLDGLFGLNPALQGVFDDYGQGHALVVHAIASPYRERSHFDGQDVLENGASGVGRARDGWLNRAIAPLGGSVGADLAIAMAQNTPLVLRGENSVTSWAPSRLPDADEDTLTRLADLYADDDFFASRLAQALRSQKIAQDQGGMAAEARGRGGDATQLASLMEATARFLSAADGPRIAVVEVGGWDTHANQGAASGALANRLAALDRGLSTLKRQLATVWSETVVALVTEFGRTVRVNGTRGTDHGTATAALLLGGAVAGGRVMTDWPGLGASDLYESRDLKPTADVRSLFKGVLADHLGLPEPFLERAVFPDSAAAKPMRDLIRS